MKTMSIMTGRGFTKDMYEALRKEVGWETEPVDGWLMHVVGFDESGEIHMMNVWESQEKNRDGFVSRLMPVMRKLGIPEPHIEVYPLHNANVFKMID